MVVENEKKKQAEMTIPDESGMVNPSEADAGKDTAGFGGYEKTAPKKKKQRKTSEALNDEVIIEIIEKFFSSESAVESGLSGRFYQHEFSKVLKELGVDILTQVAVAFLSKRGIIKIGGLSRHPIVELTKNAHELLANHREMEKERAVALEKEKKQKELLEFPSKSLKQLLRLRAMVSKQSMLDENRAAQKVILSRMDEIRLELKSSEENLEILKKEERRFLIDIEKTLLRIKLGSIEALILLAQTPVE